jgi:hypothetical protein
MNEQERKRRLVVTALAAQQIYAQCHDECVELKFFRQDLKMHSKNLVAKLERELMPIYGVLGNVQGGEAYLNAVEIMELTLQNLATLPVEYWVLISKGIDDIKQQIDEKNQASADGVSSGAAKDSSSEQENGGDADNNEESSDTQEHEAAGNPTTTEPVQ